MKFKKILLAGILLLAILTIGAVSASGNVTDSDVLDTADDTVFKSTDSSEVLNDGSYFDEDFYIYVEENYTHGMRDWNSYELIYIASYSQKNSTIDILVDDVEKQSINVTDGYFSIGKYENGTEYYNYYTFVYPTDLSLNYGLHNIKVNVNGNTRIDTSISVNEKENFTIWLQNPYYCEEEYWQTPSFIIIDSNNLNNGTLEIYVNGTRKLTYSVTNGLFEEIEGCSNKSRYVAPSDLLEGYGNYNIQIRFTENGVTKTLANENVTVAEFAPTVNPHLEVYFDFYDLIIPADNVAHIYLPREATGKLTISYNNVVNKTVVYSKGYGEDYMESWNLNHLGENTIYVTYIGDDFGTLTTTATVVVLPKITCPSYVGIGKKFNITLLTHGWVNGELRIYEYNGGVKGKLLASADIDAYSHGDFALTSLSISSSKSGLNQFYLDYYDYYAGHYGIIQDVNVVQNSESVNVNVAKEMEPESSLNITVTAPVSDFTFAQISVDGAESEFVMLENGAATKIIQNLAVGYHTVNVFYENGYYVDGKFVGDIYLNTFTVNVGQKTNLTATDVVADYNSGNLIATLRDVDGNALSGVAVKVNVDGREYVSQTNKTGQAIFAITAYAGNYTALVSFEGAPGYLSSNTTSKITVNKAKSKLSAAKITTAYNVAKNLVITLYSIDGKKLAGKHVIVTLKGNKYDRTTDSNGQIKISSYNLPPKTYTASIKFAGDNNYMESSTTVKVVVNKAKPKIIASNKVYKLKTKTKKYTITLKNNKNVVMKNKKVTLAVGKKKYTAKTNSKGKATFKITKLNKKGSYKAVIKYAADAYYNAISKNVKIVVKK